MIRADNRIAERIYGYLFLKVKLIKRNSRFNNLNNPMVFNIVGKQARIQDVAKVSDEGHRELLVFINITLLFMYPKMGHEKWLIERYASVMVIYLNMAATQSLSTVILLRQPEKQ